MKKELFTIRNFLFLILLTGICFSPAYAKQPEWLRKVKKIEILKTTKAEVEKLFGNPKIIETRDLAVEFKNGWGKEITYETRYGNLEVAYAAGKCSESKGPYAYDIAADVVFGVIFSPSEIAFENQLGYDLSKFRKDYDWQTDKTYSLETEKSEIIIKIQNLQVSSIKFDISDKYKERLECKNTKVKEPIWLEKLRTLEIFKSTRSDVEILFDNPRILEIDDSVKDGDDWIIEVEYETIYGKLQAEYSTGKCFERQSKYGFDAAKDTLVELTFIPNEELDATEINYDLRKLRAGLGEELGVSIETLKGRVVYIRFYPSEKQAELDCDKVLNLQN